MSQGKIVNHIYSTMVIISLISFNLISSQAPAARHDDFENFYAIIETKAFEHEQLREKKESLANYRNIFLGGSMYVAFELLRGSRPSQKIDFGLSPWVYPASGLVISLILSMIIKNIERQEIHTYEQPVVNCFKQVDKQQQNKLIRLLEERNMAVPSKCVATFSVIKWLRACQQKAIMAQYSK